MGTNRRDTWRCDECGKKVDTLYFVGKRELCESCRRPHLNAIRRRLLEKSRSAQQAPPAALMTTSGKIVHE